MESINELEKEIENFRKNMAVSGEICSKLSNISDLIKNQTVSLNETSNDVISKFSKIPESIKKINEPIVSKAIANIANENGKYIEYLEKYKNKIDELENKVELNKKNIDKSIDDTVEKMKSIPKIISRDCQMSNAELTVIIEEMIQEKINIVLDNAKSASDNFAKCSELFTNTKSKIESSIELIQNIQNEFKSVGESYTKEISGYTNNIGKIISQNNLDLAETLNKSVSDISSSFEKNNEENIIAIDNLKEDLNAKSNELEGKIENVSDAISSIYEKITDNSASIAEIKSDIDNVTFSNNDIKESLNSISEKNSDKINELDGKIENIGYTVSSIENKATDNSAFITDIKNEVGNVINSNNDIKETLNNIFEKSGQIEKNIKELDSKVTSETNKIDAEILKLVNKSDDDKNEILNILSDIKKSNEKEISVVGEKVDKKANNLEGILNQNRKQILNQTLGVESKITKKIEEMNKTLTGKINKIDIESIKKQNENLKHLISVRTTIMFVISGLAVVLAILGFIF